MRLFLLTALTMIAFAANSVLNRLALAGAAIGPEGFAAIRLASGAVALSVLVMLRGRTLPLRGPGRGVMVAGLTVYVLGFSFAYVSLNAGVGALILFGTVQITMFAGALIGGEVVPARRWLGAAMAFGGLVWLLWPLGAGAPAPGGAALMAAAGAGWGVYSLKGRGQADPQAATAANFLLAAPVALLLWALVPGQGAASPEGVVLAVVSGVVTSGLGYALWYSVLPQLAPSVAAVAQLTVPVIAMTGGALWLGEVPDPRLLLAAVVVLGGVALSVLRRQRVLP